MDRLIGALFACGSVLFFVPGVAALWTSAEWVFWAFAFGAVFFTSAAALQLFSAETRLDVLASAIQLPGTILFNVNTLEALDGALDPMQYDVRVWTPDMLGGACFLASSLVACHAVGWGWRPREREWQIAAANLLGSAFFGVSALAAFVGPKGDAVAADLANATTALGALGFLAGALLLLPKPAATG